MAIIKGIRGISVAISIDGRDLKEYRDRNLRDEPNTVTRYVESQNGREFQTKFQVKTRTRMRGGCLVFVTYMDGPMNEVLIDTDMIKKNDGQEICKGFWDDRTARQIKFSIVETGNSAPVIITVIGDNIFFGHAGFG